MKCPKCGSESYAKILYGTPAFDDDFRLPTSLQERLDKKEIILGGCCIHPNSPKYMCLNCRFKYGSEPYYISEDTDARDSENYLDCRQAVTCFSFTIGGYFTGSMGVDIARNNQEAVIVTIPPLLRTKKEQISKDISDDQWDTLVEAFHLVRISNMDSTDFLKNAQEDVLLQNNVSKSISLCEWGAILDRLFSELLIHEWDDEFNDPNILDGTQWCVQYKCGDFERRIGGSNKYPPYWKQFRAYMDELTEFSPLQPAKFFKYRVARKS